MIDKQRYPYLADIESPSDLRKLGESELPRVADELRDYLIQTLSHCGGHFAAGLGTVELTVALHYIFNTPDDRLVFDVGHQTYPHKVLTGRRDQLSSIRQKNGLTPFPKRKESEYDTFGVGHSSTSISAALGMAIAARITGSNRKSVAIIGDGAMTAGMAFEALNHGGHLPNNVLVILNDNEMSISENVGAMNKYLARILSGQKYSQIREGGKKALANMPTVGDLARRSEEFMKGMVLPPGTLFEELGWNYIGPIDGHDLDALLETLTNMRDLDGPQFLHIVTKKGKGFAPAEADPIKYHGVGAFNPETGKFAAGSSGGGPTYTKVFGDWLCDMAAQDERIVAITPAMREGSGLVEYSKQYPERYFDVAIAEQHAVTVAAGMACDGLKPVVAIYSTFLQRGYDQMLHDIALQNLPVVFAIDRAGFVGPDGPTHAGAYDLSFMRCVPNMTIMTPADENECRQMLYTAHTLDSPTAVRYPRGKGPGVEVQTEMTALPIGKAEVRRQGSGKIALLAFGCMLADALVVADELDATVINMRFVKPLDEAMVLAMAEQHSVFVTLEDNVVAGGAGSAVNECLQAHNISIPVLNLGHADNYVEHGSREELLTESGLDTDGIRQSIAQRFGHLIAKQVVGH